MMIKNLNTLKYDEGTHCSLRQLRESIHMKSISKDKTGMLQQLQSFHHNPDLVGSNGSNDMAKQW